MDTTTRKKLEDIKRLMEAAGTVGEAEAATAAMQRLMFRHNLTAEDLATLDTSSKEEYSADFISVGDRKSRGLQWKLNLLYVLAEYNFCVFIRYGHHGGDGVLVGQQVNKDAVRMMFDATVLTVDRIADLEWYLIKNNLTEWYKAGGPSTTAWKNSFKIGFVTGLRLKMQLERKSEVLEDNRASALVSLKDMELKEAVTETVGKTSTHKGSAPTNAAGYNRGVEKGRTHDLQSKLG